MSGKLPNFNWMKWARFISKPAGVLMKSGFMPIKLPLLFINP